MKKNTFLHLTVVLLLCPVLAMGANKKKVTESAATESVSRTEAAAGELIVNGRTIPADELRMYRADRLTNGAPNTPETSTAVREQMIVREIFAQEARKAKLDKTAEVQIRERMLREELYARSYQNSYLASHPVAESAVKAAYDALIQRAGSTEYHLRQIFVPTEAEASALIARLKKGERFEVLASTASRDDSSREKGGDLGWLSLLRLQPDIAGAVGMLQKGDYTRSPVKSQSGWHVILAEDTRPFVLPAYEQMAVQLKRELARGVLDAHLAQLRRQAVIR